MLIKHSAPVEAKDYKTQYLVQYENGDFDLVEVLPWFHDVGFTRDDSISSLKSVLEFKFSTKVELQYDSTLMERL